MPKNIKSKPFLVHGIKMAFEFDGETVTIRDCKNKGALLINSIDHFILSYYEFQRLSMGSTVMFSIKEIPTGRGVYVWQTDGKRMKLFHQASHNCILDLSASEFVNRQLDIVERGLGIRK